MRGNKAKGGEALRRSCLRPSVLVMYLSPGHGPGMFQGGPHRWARVILAAALWEGCHHDPHFTSELRRRAITQLTRVRWTEKGRGKIQTHRHGTQSWILKEEGNYGTEDMPVFCDAKSLDRTKQKSLLCMGIEAERDRSLDTLLIK